MNFEDIIAELGEFGPYQKRIYFLACLVIIPWGMQTFIIIFSMGHQDHRCAIPELPNDTYTVQNAWHHEVINRWIPAGDLGQAYSQCQVYVKDKLSGEITNQTGYCDHYVYDTSVFTATMTSEANMVCDRKSETTYLNMMYMTGMLIGSLLFGILSDAFGRKRIMIVCIVGEFTSALLLALTSTLIPFALLRFTTAFFGIGTILTTFVLGMEIVGPKARRITGIVLELFWVLGLFLLVFLAYLIRDWRYLQIVIAAPCVLLISYELLLVESPRWLILKGRYQEATKIIEKAARVNKVTLSSNVLDLTQIELEGPQGKLWEMFTIKILLMRCVFIMYFWVVCSLVYYGLTLNVSALSGDVHLNFTLSALVEGAGYVVILIVLDKTGRILVLSSSMLLSGVACLGTMFPVIFGAEDLAWITQVLSLIGKFGASIAFAGVYVYTAEFFPTSIRNSGLGLCSFFGRLGGIISPYIADLGKIVPGMLGEVLPLIVFGAAAILAGLLILLLPETTNRLLPETVQDAKNFQRKVANRYPITDKELKFPGDNSDTNQTTELMQNKSKI